jgi:hypothetical protein
MRHDERMEGKPHPDGKPRRSRATALLLASVPVQAALMVGVGALAVAAFTPPSPPPAAPAEITIEIEPAAGAQAVPAPAVPLPDGCKQMAPYVGQKASYLVVPLALSTKEGVSLPDYFKICAVSSWPGH